jgi:hypothetical protein
MVDVLDPKQDPSSGHKAKEMMRERAAYKYKKIDE